MNRMLALPLLLATGLAAHAGEAGDLVRSFYQPDVVSGFEPEVRDRFTKPAIDLFAKNDKMAKADGMGCLDFALSIDAQDYDLPTITKTLKIEEDVIDGTTTAVSALFQLFPGDETSKREIVWTVRLVDGKWKVSDIASPANDWWLSKFECE